MQKSPFKFLDSYTKDDREIFFGREREVEELYSHVFAGKTLLVYGISGTGKSSLIYCGLANKFNDSDWLPVFVRRGNNINESLIKALEKNAITSLKPTKNLSSLVKSLYLDNFKPIYLIFDQFEELFIFGSKEEKKDFVQQIKKVLQSDIQCKIIFVIREEYLASITEFEEEIADILLNRIRIEKMNRQQTNDVIDGPCRVAGIKLEIGFTEALIEKLSPQGSDIELTYLQVYLDKIFRTANETSAGNEIYFNIKILDQLGNVGDLLGAFLEEQVSKLSDGESAMIILKSFVSTEGTKRQIDLNEVSDFSKILGKKIDSEIIRQLVSQFVDLRILKDKDEHGKYELRHDALASKIYEKITLVEKELIEIKQFIESAYKNFIKRKILLNDNDLKYLAHYEDKLFLTEELKVFVSNSRKEIEKTKKRKRNILIAVTSVIIIVLSGFTFWAVNERSNAVEALKKAEQAKSMADEAVKLTTEAKKQSDIEKTKAEKNEIFALTAKDEAEKAKAVTELLRQQAEMSKKDAVFAKEKAEQELYSNIKSSLSVSAEKMNVLMKGINNPVTVAVSGVSSDKLIPLILKGECKFEGKNGNYIITPFSDYLEINVKGITNQGDTLDFGIKEYKVIRLPDPIPIFAGKKGNSTIRKNDLAFVDGLSAESSSFLFNVKFEILSFSITSIKGGVEYTIETEGEKVSEEQRNLLQNLKEGDKFFIENIKAICSDGEVRDLTILTFKII